MKIHFIVGFAALLLIGFVEATDDSTGPKGCHRKTTAGSGVEGPSEVVTSADISEAPTTIAPSVPETTSQGPTTTENPDINRTVFIYPERDFQGEPVLFVYGSNDDPRGCQEIKDCQSSDFSGDFYCMRLFESNSCSGYSQAVYPGATVDPTNSIVTGFKSVGHCYTDELNNTTPNDLNEPFEVIKSELNLKRFPDLIPLTVKAKGPEPRPSDIIYDESDKRTDYVCAQIPQGVFQNPEGSLEELLESSKWKGLEKQDGDSLGVIIPVELGGKLQPVNIFPQSESNREQWKKILDAVIAEHRLNTGTPTLGVNFQYSNENSTRPYGFFYWVKLSNPEGYLYDFIQN